MNFFFLFCSICKCKKSIHVILDLKVYVLILKSSYLVD